MCLVVVLGACVSMSACQSLGTPVIQLDIDMDVQSSDVPSQKSDVTYVASAPLFPFEWPHYSGKEVEWTFQTHPNGFSIDVKNVGELDVELAWNEARWRSSFQDNWDDFLVYEQFIGRLNNRKLAILENGESQFVPEAWTLHPGAEEYFSFRATVGKGAENPEGLLFGVSEEQVIAGSFQSAIDRWVELEFPVVASDNTTIYVLRLVLNDAASWTSYY